MGRSDVITAELQAALAATLRYFHHGDMGTFARACVVAGVPCGPDERFRYADLFLTAQLAGLVDVNHSDGNRMWWASVDQDIFVRSECSKWIPTRTESVAAYDGVLRALVLDQQGQQLLIGGKADRRNLAVECCDFGKSFLLRLPSLRMVERQLVREEAPWPRDEALRKEVFWPDTAQWRPEEHSDAVQRGLVRSRKKFTGWTYQVVAKDLGLGFTITDPEWVFPLALNILGWDVETFASYEGGRLQIKRAFRLPSLLLRFLFANAGTTRVGPVLIFGDICADAAGALLNYLSLPRG